MQKAIAYHTATIKADFQKGRVLFEEYAASLNFDLCFQNFAEELQTLHIQYAKPHGILLLAESNGIMIGCAGVRSFAADIAELKRLYVKPDFRGYKVGLELLTRAIDAARSLGYKKLRLDTLNDMAKAVALYRSLGFYDIPAYRSNPHEGIYLELVL